MNNPTIEEINEQEKVLFADAFNKYGEFFKNAYEFNGLLQNCIKTADPEAWIFIMFLAQVKKHLTLAMFSAARLHHTQTMLNLRYLLEAGVNAAYGLDNPRHEDFIAKDSAGIMTAPGNLMKKRYKWMEKHHPKHSKFIHGFKKVINDSTAHSNMIYGFSSFSTNFPAGRFDTPFFDIEDEYHIKTDFWQIGNAAMGLMDLFYGVNLQAKRATFIPEFVERLKTLEKINHQLKAELQTNPRFKKDSAA